MLIKALTGAPVLEEDAQALWVAWGYAQNQVLVGAGPTMLPVELHPHILKGLAPAEKSPDKPAPSAPAPKGAKRETISGTDVTVLPLALSIPSSPSAPVGAINWTDLLKVLGPIILQLIQNL